MKIIENALPNAIFEKLQAEIFRAGFAWYCYENPHYADETNQFGQVYAHMAFVNGQAHSPIAEDLAAYLKTIIEADGRKVTGVGKIIVEALNGGERWVEQLPHVDLTEEHEIGYLFLNDNDGELVIYDEKFTLGEDHYEDYLAKKNETLNITQNQLIKPVANTFVCFDGLFYHCDRSPMNANRRIVVSYCYKAE